tara:strand:- start:105 stop:269 length:165 start_codon:yes stop_codon:yes gene_type:complete
LLRDPQNGSGVQQGSQARLNFHNFLLIALAEFVQQENGFGISAVTTVRHLIVLL